MKNKKNIITERTNIMITEQNIDYITAEHIEKLSAHFVEQLCELSTAQGYGYNPIVELGDGSEWLIIKNDDTLIEEAVAQSIDGIIEYFSPGFLADLTELPEAVFEAIQEAPNANSTVKQILEKCNLSMLDVASEALRWDSAGHHLSPYDGDEVRNADDEYIFFRQN